jgi:5-methylthioadenosine/S-adenosylhomocysteine deaminase
MSILIKDASFVLTQSKCILKDSDIFIEDDRIVEIGKNLKNSAEFVVDGRKKIVMPGLINSHTHVSMTLLRGLADDLPLMDWLKNHIWPTEQHLTAKDVYHGALLGCLEMIKSGTTCFGDMYFFADEVGRAVELSGIKSLVSSVVVDLLPENIAGLKVLTETLKKVRQLNCSRVIPWIGPHSPYSCSEETLKKVKEISKKEKLRINIHLSESESEIEEIKNKYEKNPVEFLDDLEFLDSSVVAAHCVHLTEKEMKILREKDVKVVHNPVSNMKTASGVAPVPEMLQKKICVALGTDGAASNNCLDLFQEMKFAALLHKINKLNPTVIPAERVLDFATVNGARALGLESQIGSIETGKKADIIILNVKKPNMTPILSNHSITSHLVYSATGNDVETSIVDGKIIMENRKVLTLKEEDVIEKSQEVAEDLQSRTSKPL